MSAISPWLGKRRAIVVPSITMGWYTSNGADTFQWKYGSVVSLSAGSGLGSLVLVPRLQVLDEDGEILEGEEFLGPLQHWALAHDLPWKKPILFDPEDHESVAVPNDVDVGAVLAKWAKNVRANRKSVLAALRHFNDVDDDEAFVQASVSTDAIWRLSESEYGALVAWLNAPLSNKKGSPRFSLEDLRAGGFDKLNEYEPNAATKPAIAALRKGDDARLMAAHALGHALVEGSKLELFQPNDDYDVDVWGSEGE
jgi:hypothetical protein